MNKIINRSFGRMQNNSTTKEEVNKRSDK